jgi:hypothetical protein
VKNRDLGVGEGVGEKSERKGFLERENNPYFKNLLFSFL